MLTQLLQALSAPLLLEPAMGAKLVSVFGRKLLHGESFDGARLHTELGIASPGSRQSVARDAKIAVIPIVGIIAQRAQSLGTSTDEIGAMVDRAVADTDVIGILYDVDSPGGTVPGVPETAMRIREAAKVKASLALSNGLAASAGFWLAAAAGEVWQTKSGDGVGSIGVWTAHEDWSKFLEQEGVDITLISAGKYKTEGNPWEPLSPEAKAFLRGRVDEVYDWFTADVAQDRGDTPANVRAGYGEGRVLSGKAAVKAGLANKIGTFEEAVERLVAKAKPKRSGPKVAVLREQLALDAARLIG